MTFSASVLSITFSLVLILPQVDCFFPKTRNGKYIIVETEDAAGGGSAPMGKLTAVPKQPAVLRFGGHRKEFFSPCGWGWRLSFGRSHDFAVIVKSWFWAETFQTWPFWCWAISGRIQGLFGGNRRFVICVLGF